MAVISRVTFCATLLGLSFAAGLAKAEGPATVSAAEDAFLDIVPRVEVPDMVEPIPGAVNEEFRHCEALWPSEYAQAQSRPEARALRDIYSFVRGRNVVLSGDCGCSGKVANWADVETIAAELRKEHRGTRLTWQHTKAVSTEARRLIAAAETLCGGPF